MPANRQLGEKSRDVSPATINGLVYIDVVKWDIEWANVLSTFTGALKCIDDDKIEYFLTGKWRLSAGASDSRWCALNWLLAIILVIRCKFDTSEMIMAPSMASNWYGFGVAMLLHRPKWKKRKSSRQFVTQLRPNTNGTDFFLHTRSGWKRTKEKGNSLSFFPSLAMICGQKWYVESTLVRTIYRSGAIG